MYYLFLTFIAQCPQNGYDSSEEANPLLTLKKNKFSVINRFFFLFSSTKNQNFIYNKTAIACFDNPMVTHFMFSISPKTGSKWKPFRNSTIQLHSLKVSGH